MRTICAAAVVIAISVFILAFAGADHAQQAVPVPGGDALQAKAEKVRDALLKGTPDEFLAQLAPWLQGRAALTLAEAPTKLEKMSTEERENFGKFWKEKGTSQEGPDPANMLKISKIEDWAALSIAQMVGLSTGYYRLHGSAELKTRRDAKWHLVDRNVGFEQFQEKRKGVEKSAWVSRTRGRVTFMSAGDRDGFIVSCVAEGDTWQVDDVEFRVGTAKGDLSWLQKGTWNRLLKSTESVEAMRDEAEQQLGSMKGQARVAFARLGRAPTTLTGKYTAGGANVNADELQGKYSRICDVVADKGQSALLMTEPLEGYENVGYGVITFRWANSDAEFDWYETLDEVYAAHPALKAK